LNSDLLFDKRFSAIGTDLRGDVIDEQAKFITFKRNGGETINKINLSANDAIHKIKPFQIMERRLQSALYCGLKSAL
jgi:hypothetical protein